MSTLRDDLAKAVLLYRSNKTRSLNRLVKSFKANRLDVLDGVIQEIALPDQVDKDALVHIGIELAGADCDELVRHAIDHSPLQVLFYVDSIAAVVLSARERTDRLMARMRQAGFLPPADVGDLAPAVSEIVKSGERRAIVDQLLKELPASAASWGMLAVICSEPRESDARWIASRLGRFIESARRQASEESLAVGIEESIALRGYLAEVASVLLVCGVEWTLVQELLCAKQQESLEIGLLCVSGHLGIESDYWRQPLRERFRPIVRPPSRTELERVLAKASL
jgi:hypothetical protein